ncbi:Voltage-dependent calcium channel subunit alpha-2/delta-4 [Desmophyllum pertusum]|uniref:Voltage-dependent calcium channel subunit alpha-2/delta-4 n=1 Tax=Desmophyllum pertusum TaxID=174260 RepID=A0A9W9YVI3_9CNID|nr:Voltage-dependent calcium channel subunit alpha-2/delta-4 [Desmophyllum pertusum]
MTLLNNRFLFALNTRSRFQLKKKHLKKTRAKTGKRESALGSLFTFFPRSHQSHTGKLSQSGKVNHGNTFNTFDTVDGHTEVNRKDGGEVSRLLLFSCGLILLSSSRVSGIDLTSAMVRQWADRIGKEASEFTENLTGAKYLKQAYENLTFTTEDVIWSEVLNRMRTEMEAFFSNKTSSLKKLVKKAEDAYCKYKYNKNLKISEIDYPNSKDLHSYLNKTGLTFKYNSTFKTEVSFNRSVVHVPTDVYDGASEIVNGIKWTSGLDSVFDNNRHSDPSLSWQYFGSDKGFMRTYPAKHWDDNNPNHVDLFDARRRPWYIQGATSPKNIIILIDASGSMHGVPMRIAKLSAQNLIDTFGDNDFFNVVYFNKDSFVLCCHETGPTLLQATKKNKLYVKNELQKIKDGDVAVWIDGMSQAFALLRKANDCALCQQAIMVLSDGTTSSLKDLFAEHNKDKKVRVFTFAVGPLLKALRLCGIWLVTTEVTFHAFKVLELSVKLVRITSVY